MSGNQAENTSFQVALTQEERELYSRLFKALDPESSGIVTGEKARTTFEKSGLPANILGEIWQLADSKNLGFLTQFGFCHAMRLIGYTQAGHFPTAQLAETPGPLPKFAELALPNQALRSQSTSGSLLQAQPSSLIPQNTATQQTSPQAPIASVSPADFEKFSQVFVKTTGSRSASLDGNSAKSILMKAKLPTTTLGQIWSLVDVNNRGFLDLPSFVMAMHLIHGLLSGTLKQLPPFLPEHVWKSVDFTTSTPVQTDRQTSYSSMNSQSSTIRHPPSQQPSRATPSTGANAVSAGNTEWQVTPLQKQQFDSIFDSLDKTKTGSLAADQVASFLMTSRLDQQDLATIWDLSDIQNTGIFTKLEFGIALFLINRRRSGLAMPDVVPEQLISSLSQGLQPSDQLTQAPQTKANAQSHLQASSANSLNRPKSSLDELADIFDSPAPGPPTNSSQAPESFKAPGIQPRASSSDLSQSRKPPRVRQQLTSSFKPSSSFGQSLVTTNQASTSQDAADLIGEDVSPVKISRTQDQPSSPPVPQFSSPAVHLVPEQVPKASTVSQSKSVDYEALRSVPAPPQVQTTRSSIEATEPVSRTDVAHSGNAPPSFSSQSNNDLLADSEVSGKLSDATSDIANFSNQIKSLSTQTSSLHEKKLRAEKELSRILTIKEEINVKLKSLRTSYASEVKQVEQVEMNLNNAKEELEALRREASIAEAKFNSISNEFNEKQLAVEENQKVNSSLREKLGNLNAEIAALETEHKGKADENQKLSNEVNVRKSQVNVALVKVDELKRKIAETESTRESYFTKISELEKQKSAAESQSDELISKQENSSRDVKELESKHSILAGGVGAAAGLVAGIGASKLFGNNDAQKTPVLENERSVNKTDMHSTGAEPIFEGSKKDVSLEEYKPKVETSTFDSEDINPQTGNASFSVAGLVDEVKQHPTKDLTGLDDVRDVKHEDDSFKNSDSEVTTHAPLTRYSVAGLVDEVKEDPAEDFTGLDDLKNVDHKNIRYEDDETESLKHHFPPVPLGYENPGHLSNQYSSNNFHDGNTKLESTSSGATEFYKQNDGGDAGETPITTPSNSEYRFQSSNAGVVGGMVGMPGVLVGVQRTESLTSSIQNNPSLSVRDDNIDEISDRDTLEDNSAFVGSRRKGAKQSEGRYEESSEGERLSSGVESFELVNADEAKGTEGTRGQSKAVDVPTHPLAQSYRASEYSSGSGSQQVEELSPPRELDYDESSSDESDRNVAIDDKFDDANENFTNSVQPPPEYDYDSEFNDLKPASNEVAHEDPDDEFFDEDFEHLKLADDDNQGEIDAHDLSIDDHFTGSNDFGGFSQHIAASKAPDFSNVANGVQAENDEWEKLFAGFGNGPAIVETQQSKEDNSSHDSAVQELVAMGFEKEMVIEALKRENHDVEAATNYLLDNA